MRIGPAYAEARQAGPPGRAVARFPRAPRRLDPERGLVEFQLGIGAREVDLRRDRAVLKHEHRLDEPGCAGRDIAVAKVRLHRSDGTEAGFACLPPEGLRQGPHLDRIADQRCSSMRFDIADGCGIGFGHIEGSRNGLRLPVHPRRREARPCGSVIVDRVAFDNGEHGVARGERVIEAAKHHSANAVAQDRAAGRFVEGAAMAIARADMPLDRKISALREGDAGGACQRHAAAPAPHSLRRLGDGDESRGAGGLHRDSRTFEAEDISHAAREIILVVAGFCEVKGGGVRRVEMPRGAKMMDEIARKVAAGINPGQRSFASRGVPGPLQCLPAAF